MNRFKNTFNPLRSDTTRFSQTENSDVFYVGNWGPAIQTETISASAWSVESGSVTLSTESNTITTTTAQMSGEPGESIVVNKVTLSDGQIYEHKILLKIKSNDTPIINRDYGFC